MAIRKVYTDEHPVLRKKNKKVMKINPEIVKLIDDMIETLYEANGIGLAAPQIGVNKRIIVVDVGEGLYKLINPRILESEGSEIDLEGCLSVPDKIGEVDRYTKIKVKALTPDGKPVIIDAEGLFARCLQHEIDHLEGILFIDKAENIREPEYYDEDEMYDEDGNLIEEIEEEEEYEEPEEEVKKKVLKVVKKVKEEKKAKSAKKGIPITGALNQQPAIFQIKG